MWKAGDRMSCQTEEPKGLPLGAQTWRCSGSLQLRDNHQCEYERRDGNLSGSHAIPLQRRNHRRERVTL